MRFIGILGIICMIGIAVLFSKNRKKIRWQLVVWALSLQLIFALLILKTATGQFVFLQINDFVLAVLSSVNEGSKFVFGKLTGFTVPVSGVDGETGKYVAETGAYFAFTVLPTIVFFSSLMAILYYVGLMKFIITSIAKFLQKTLKTTAPESLSVAANIFVGQTESPLVVRPFLEKMTLSELNAVMTGGFATIAGGVLAAFVGMLQNDIPNVAGHLVAASIMSAPAALMMAKILVPEDTVSNFAFGGGYTMEKTDKNLIDAATRGASEGLMLAVNVGAMLIAFIALVALLDKGLGFVGGFFDMPYLTLTWIFGKIFAPLAFLMGVPWEDCITMGDLIGTKIFINEFMAFTRLKEVTEAGILTTDRAKLIATYALCGFANVGSIGIQVGGIGALAPGRRKDLSTLAVRALIGGAFASFTTACIAGILL